MSDQSTASAADGELGPLAWTALVARWVEVARASRAIPPEFAQLRDSIPHLIAIESTTAALGELAKVPEVDRPHARAVAEVTVRRAAAELDRLWRGEEWPQEITDACEAAERALQRAVYAGLDALVVTGDRAIVVPELDLGLDPSDPSTARGTLAAMPPGSLAMPGEPICWWSGRAAPRLLDSAAPAERPMDEQPASEHLVVEHNAAPLQVYRGLDERGRFTADTLAPISAEVLPGLPMLVPILLEGTLIGRFLHGRDAWLAMQRAAMDGRDTIPVG
ncbi:MAG: hypothetical protein RLY21_202 [Planctomycetota bacterium]